MGLYVPSGSDFKWEVSNVDGVRPAASYGTFLTVSGTYTFSVWTTLIAGASVTNDAYGIMINFNSGAASAGVRQYLVDIGVDNTGGINYRTVIPYLMAGAAAPYNVGGGIWYYFPLFIPAGSSVGVRLMGNTNGSTLRCVTTLYGQPKKPDSVRVGSKVYAFGTVAGSNGGTAITYGTTAEGAWTTVGTTTTELWWWQVGCWANDTSMAAAAIHLDLGARANGQVKSLINNSLIITTATEQMSNLPITTGCTGYVAAGTELVMRGQHSGTLDTLSVVAAYGLGG